MKKFKALYRDVWYLVKELVMFEDGSVAVGMLHGISYSPDDEHIKAIVQFTGLKDKNGKEIYEGDTIKCSDWVEDAHAYNEWERVVEWDIKSGIWLGVDGEINEVVGNVYACTKTRDGMTIRNNEAMNKESLNPITITACVVCQVYYRAKNELETGYPLWTKASDGAVVIGQTIEECEEIAKHLHDDRFEVLGVKLLTSYKYKSFSYHSSEQMIDVFIAPPKKP